MSAVVLSIAGTLIGKYFQDRSAAAQQRRERLMDLVPRVNRSLDDISNSLNALSYYADQALYAMLYREETYKNQHKNPQPDTDWKHYIQALSNWQITRTSHIAQAVNFFGEDITQQLRNLHTNFETLDQQLKATFYGRTQSSFYLVDKEGSDNDFRAKYLDFKATINAAIEKVSIDMVTVANNLHRQED